MMVVSVRVFVVVLMFILVMVVSMGVGMLVVVMMVPMSVGVVMSMIVVLVMLRVIDWSGAQSDEFGIVGDAMLGNRDGNCVNAGAQHRLGGNIPALYRKRSEALFEFIERHTAIQQGGQGHIASDTGKTIEVSNFHKFLTADERG